MQMPSLFITATGTHVGKTHTTLKLIEAFAKQGIKTGVYKPIETGVKGEPEDAKALLEACRSVNPDFTGLAPADITAYTFSLPAAPFCADTKQEIKPEKIFEKYEELSKRCDLLLIEGAGGLMVPITQTYKMVDLAKALHCPVLLVTPSRLGCINDTLLSIEALRSRGIDFDWCVNLHEDKERFAEVTQPYYDAAFPGWWSVDKHIGEFISRLL
ncbi:MAG: dethiobiotin synthase [Sulfurovum sp.]|jgi:dethiobiotin synthetase|nr:dethiobiotin synthase [Sulfurovum sp.]MDD3499015.1 dethiobiotin synthase [Sulfurovum sp.]MDY0403364.1 dethiobiotin synthase [Sulfurovum sp.]